MSFFDDLFKSIDPLDKLFDPLLFEVFEDVMRKKSFNDRDDVFDEEDW